MKIYEAKIRQNDDTGIYAVSFVEVPAVERNFVALSRAAAAVQTRLKVSDPQKQILTGALLVPDMLIYRDGTDAPSLGEHYLKYTAQDIELISHKMMRTGVALKNTTHQHERPLRGNQLVEFWIVKDPKVDKSVALGLGEMPKGTLMASYKVRNKRYWDTQVLTGNVKGFSIEGLFNHNNVEQMKKPQVTPGAVATTLGSKNKVSAFLSAMAAMLDGSTAADASAVADEAKKDDTGSGEVALIFTLADGGEVEVDKDGYATLAADGTEMPAGEHALDDGNFITIDDNGMFVLTTPDASATTPAAAPAAVTQQRQKAKDDAKALLTKQKAADPNATKIAALQAQIAALKKEPSITQAKPTVEKTVLAKDAPFTDRVAAALSAKLERKNAAK